MIRFDCHAHVYERVSSVGTPRYLPRNPAPLSNWLEQQETHGIRGGVIVQVSFLGTDNSELVTALSRLDRRRYAGIAVTGPTPSDEELEQLALSNIRGLRWNLVGGTPLPDPGSIETTRLVDQLRAFSMHLELQLESPRLAEYLPELARLPVPVVVDHMGLPIALNPTDEPWMQVLLETRNENIYVKLSAPYRARHDPRPHADYLMSLLPQDRFLWGSDWPHTRHEEIATYPGLLADWSERIDDIVPVQALYGLDISMAAPA